MKEEMKKIILMGLGAVSLTGEKASEIKKDLLEKGESLYEKGAIKNEELKRDIKDKIKENTNIEFSSVTKEELIDIIKNMTDEEKAEIAELLKNEEKCNCNEKCSCDEKCECEDECNCGSDCDCGNDCE